MKKLILSAVILVAAFSVNAQNKFGLQGGVNFAKIISEVGSTKDKSDIKVGITAGFVADIDFGNSISFRPELNFTQKGGQNKGVSTLAGTTYNTERNRTLNYVELTPNFVYNFIGSNGKFFLGVGPNFGFGIGGKDKYKVVTTGIVNSTTEGKTNIKFDNKANSSTDPNEHFKSFDFGADIVLGYTSNTGVFVSTSYTQGLSNISADNNNSYKNNSFNVKVGFLFGSTKTKK